MPGPRPSTTRGTTSTPSWALQNPNLRVGTSSFLSPVNWESDLRLEHQNSQGIAAEVLFPNTVPPFYPSGVVTAGGPTSADDYQQRWAGIQAHNRWLKDFCDLAPGRRGGLAQVFLTNLDDAIAEVRWAKEAGLAGVLIPSDHTSRAARPLRAAVRPVLGGLL